MITRKWTRWRCSILNKEAASEYIQSRLNVSFYVSSQHSFGSPASPRRMGGLVLPANFFKPAGASMLEQHKYALVYIHCIHCLHTLLSSTTCLQYASTCRSSARHLHASPVFCLRLVFSTVCLETGLCGDDGL